MPLTADQAGQGQLRPSARAPLNKDEALVASHARCCDATLLLPANQQQPLERYDYTSLSSATVMGLATMAQVFNTMRRLKHHWLSGVIQIEYYID